MVAFRNTGVAFGYLNLCWSRARGTGITSMEGGCVGPCKITRGVDMQGARRSGKGGEPNGVELSSHSSDGARHAALALARARARAHVRRGCGEVSPVR